MRRLSFLLIAACITGAAGPVRNDFETLPLPPIPPDISSNSEPAPVPNIAARGPMELQVPRGPEVTPTMMTPRYTYQGEAFLRGSTNQVEQNRKLRPAAGLNLTVPLQ